MVYVFFFTFYNYSYWGESKPTYILGASRCIILDEFDSNLPGKFRHWNDGQGLRHHPQMALFQLPLGKQTYNVRPPRYKLVYKLQ